MANAEMCFVLDKGEQKIIRSNLHKVIEELGESTLGKSETEELKKNIWLAAHSGVKELLDLATTTVYYMIYQSYEHIVNQENQDTTGPANLESDQLFLIISENIREYNGSDKLNDFFGKAVKEAFPDTLSTREQKELLADIQHVYTTMDHARPKGTDTDEVKMMIYRAVRSGNKVLFDAATMLAYSIVKVHYTNMANKYKSKSCDVEELVNSPLYMAIMTNIKRYNGVNALQTFFEPIVKAAFTRERSVGKSMTKYYADCSVIVSRAEAELHSMGVDNATDSEISDFIRVKYKKNIAEVTIKRVHEMSKDTESIEGMTIQVADIATMDPEKLFLEEEKKQDFYKSLDSLSKRHKKVIEVLLRYTEENGVAPSDAQAQKLCMGIFPGIAKDDAKRLVFATFNEFKRIYRKKRPEDTPLNRMRIVGDIQIMEAEEEDIQNMFMECPDYFDEKEDSFDGVVGSIDLDDDDF